MKKIFFPLLLTICFSGLAQNSELTVIGNKEVVPSQLTLTGLQSVFMGNQPNWSNGDKVIIALMKLTTDAGKTTCSKVYKMSAAEVTKHWLTISIKGTIDAPVFFNTSDELQNFVSNTRGAIGIIDEAVTSSNAKTVLVDGKKVF